MNVGQLKRFLQPFVDECELYLEDGSRAKVVYRIVNGDGVLAFIPDDFYGQFKATFVQLGEAGRIPDPIPNERKEIGENLED